MQFGFREVSKLVYITIRYVPFISYLPYPYNVRSLIFSFGDNIYRKKVHISDTKKQNCRKKKKKLKIGNFCKTFMGTLNVFGTTYNIDMRKSIPNRTRCVVCLSSTVYYGFFHSLRSLMPYDGDVPHWWYHRHWSRFIYSFVIMCVVCPEGYEGKICF